jgi:pseudomonalisin
VFTHQQLSRIEKRHLSFVIGLFLLAPLSIAGLLSRSYGDDRAQLAGNHPIAAESAAAAFDADPATPLAMQVRFALRHQSELKHLLAEQQNPASPNFHKWLKTGEFFHRFGPTVAEKKAVAGWLISEGFEVTESAPSHIAFSGSIAQAQRTFALKIARFGSAGAFGNTSDPFVPARFAPVISAITGLDNMVPAMPASSFTNSAVSPEAVINGAQAFGPSDLQNFYDEQTVSGRDGGGDCIAVVGLSDFLDSTMSTFTEQFNLAPINYTREVHGTNPGINGAEIEAELDLQWAHVAAPGASIVYHLGGYLVDDITGAVDDNHCGAISISYGFCGPSPAFINGVIDPLFQQAAAQGQSVFVSSGDQGSAGLGFNTATNSCVVNSTPSVNEMGADPNVTSVGGTQFKPNFVNGNDQGYVAESAWNDASGASGGGASQIFAKPEYQTGAGVPNDGARDVPDIAMMASPISPGALLAHDENGTAQIVCCVGGTSLAAPLWAGFSRVIAEQVDDVRLGNLSPIIYQLANENYATAGFRDVTIGNNGYNGVTGFAAAPEYDQASGWGTVDFDVFADAVNELLNPPAKTSTPTATPTPQTTGGTLGVPASIGFPVTATGKPGTMKTLEIRNLSRSSALSVEVGRLAAPFTVSSPGAYSIAPRSSISIGIFLSPVGAGNVTQNLQIHSGDPKHPNATVRVTGSVRAGKLSMPDSIALSAPMSAIATRTIQLRNTGGGMLAGVVQSFGSNTPFTLLGGPISFWLAPGQAQAVTVQFRPISSGTARGSLTVAMADPAGSASIKVSGSVQ